MKLVHVPLSPRPLISFLEIGDEQITKLFPRINRIWRKSSQPSLRRRLEPTRQVIFHCMLISPSGLNHGCVYHDPLAWLLRTIIFLYSTRLKT
uniref:Uncharacterized protein n=1 Tax=Arundo donax TaxID=35708 RepID=A0A0A9CBK5_ARUDO